MVETALRWSRVGRHEGSCGLWAGRAADKYLWNRFPVPSGFLPYHCVSGRHRPAGEASPRRPKGRLGWGMRAGTYVGPWWGMRL